MKEPSGTKRSTPQHDRIKAPRGEVLDLVIALGFSLHFFENGVGFYSDRIEVGHGFAQVSKADLLAIVEFFDKPENRNLLRDYSQQDVSGEP